VTIAIVGASGEIGARLTLDLLRHGRNPRAISRKPSPRLARWSNLDFRAADLSDRRTLCEALVGCETVVNCAVDKVRGVSVREQVRRNVRACRNLFAAAAEMGVRRFIHLSSIIVVPLQVRPEVIARPFEYSREQDSYTRIKVETEKAALAASGPFDMAIVRPGVVYGPYMTWSQNAFSRVAGTTSVLPDGVSCCYAVHVDDVVGLITYLSNQPSPLPKLVWAVNREMISWPEFFRSHARAIERDAEAPVLLPPAEIAGRLQTRSPRLAAAMARWIWDVPLNPKHPRVTAALKALCRKLLRLRISGEGVPPSLLLSSTARWPDHFEFGMYMSSAAFSSADNGENLGYRYRTDFETGVALAAKWWKWENVAPRQLASDSASELLNGIPGTM
jgi:nucleoside-diphosphate-sugar epimerase